MWNLSFYGNCFLRFTNSYQSNTYQTELISTSEDSDMPIFQFYLKFLILHKNESFVDINFTARFQTLICVH